MKIRQQIIRGAQFLEKNYPDVYMALAHHRTHKGERITLEHYEYLAKIIFDQSEKMVIKKATQSGISEILSVKALVKAMNGRSVFYVLPTDRLVSRYVKNRIDRSIENTIYYKSKMKESKSFFSASTSLKHIGKGTIAFVPSNSSSAFTEFPADDLIIDELDECNQENLIMATERLSASRDPRIIYVSNPTLQNFGIDAEFNKSDKKEWFIKCGCGEWINPDFFVHIVKEVDDGEYIILDEDYEESQGKDIRMICHKCGKPIDRFKKGSWIPQAKSHISGYHISKLFSTNIKVTDRVERFNNGLKNDSELQRFYNGDLGPAFTSSGSKVNYDMLRECMTDYTMPETSDGTCIMGIDVGTMMNVIICEAREKLRLVYAGTVAEFEDIRDLYVRYRVRIGCVDAMPEKRLSKKICGLRGMFMVYYGDVKKETINIDSRIITIDRTSSLDAVKELILTRGIELPRNADKLNPLTQEGISELFYQLCTSTRIYNQEKERYEWAEGSNPDHYFHGMNYMLIAKRILMKVI